MKYFGLSISNLILYDNDNNANNARLDIHARGQRSVLDYWVCYPNADSYRDVSSTATYCILRRAKIMRPLSHGYGPNSPDLCHFTIGLLCLRGSRTKRRTVDIQENDLSIENVKEVPVVVGHLEQLGTRGRTRRKQKSSSSSTN